MKQMLAAPNCAQANAAAVSPVSGENQHSIFEKITEAFAALDINWRYIYINKKAAEIFEVNATELIGKNAWEVFPNQVNGPIYNAYHKALETQEYVFLDQYYPNQDRWLENHIYPTPEGVSVFLREVTIQKKAEERILKANRLYHFTSEVNQMILRVSDELEIYREVCSIAIRTGKFSMAWIGLINHDTQMIEPVVSDGAERGYLKGIRIMLSVSTPGGAGPVGVAMREGHYDICNDIEIDPRMALWKEKALERGFHSVMAVPIRKSGAVIGVFALYADRRNFFDAPEIKLLKEVTENLSFALGLFEKEKGRREVANAILESEQRYATLTEISPVGIFRTDLEGLTTYVNPCWCDIAGMKPEQALGKGWLRSVHPDDQEKMNVPPNNGKVQDARSLYEYRFLRPDKSVIWVMGQSIPEKNGEGEIVGYVGTVTDITERKLSEIAVKATAERYRKAQEIGKMGHWELNLENNSLFWSDEIFSIFDTRKDSQRPPYETFFNAIHPDDREEFIKVQAAASAGIRNMDITHRITNRRGKISYVHEQGEVIYNEQGQRILTGTVQDVTELIKARNEIIREKNISDNIINSLPGIFYLFNKEGRYLRWNRNLETVSGYSAEEIAEMHPIDFFEGADKMLITETIYNVFKYGESKAQAGLLKKNKDLIPYYFTGILIQYDGQNCLMGLGIDFTERILAKKKIKETSQQLRELTSHLVSIREEERKRIGREIHDELGQQLTAIKMDVAWINKKTPEESTVIKTKFRNIIKLLDGGSHSIRRILSELRPAILDNYGLIEAIRWQAEQFSANTSIPVEISTTENQLQISEHISTSVFRICQEAFTNIMRYAEATQVSISISLTAGILSFSIEDDGRGFDIALLQTKKSFGILGMKERIHSLLGKFDLITSENNGTAVSIEIPVNINETTITGDGD